MAFGGDAESADAEAEVRRQRRIFSLAFHEIRLVDAEDGFGAALLDADQVAINEAGAERRRADGDYHHDDVHVGGDDAFEAGIVGVGPGESGAAGMDMANMAEIVEIDKISHGKARFGFGNEGFLAAKNAATGWADANDLPLFGGNGADTGDLFSRAAADPLHLFKLFKFHWLSILNRSPFE